MTTVKPRYLAVTPTRNEGPFILEWVAWYRMLGFDDILILSNDCSDHSPQMLDLLAAENLIDHLNHHPSPDTPPLKSAFRAARRHPLVETADWLFLCDIDEFLILHEGDGTIQGFIGDGPPDVAGIAFHWKVFGTGGQKTWQDGFVHRSYVRAAHEQSAANTFFKSIIYKPERFGEFQSHSPRRFNGLWGETPNVWIDSNGRVIPDYNPNENSLRATKKRDVVHTNAQINHYITRSYENFAYKKGQQSASSLVDRYTAKFLVKFDRNEEIDQTALRSARRFDVFYAELAAIPGVMRLHHLCCADFVQAMCLKRGDDPHEDARYRHHMAAAERLENERSG